VNKKIEEVIKEAESKNVSCLIDKAYEYFNKKSNLLLTELFARNALETSQSCGEAMDLLDQLGNVYYGKKKSTIDNNDFSIGDIDINKLKNRLSTIKEFGIIQDILPPSVIDGGAEEVVNVINNAFLGKTRSAVILVKTFGEKCVDPEYMNNLRILNKRIESHGTLDYIKAINKSILRNIINTRESEIIKNKFTIDRNKFVMKFYRHKACAYCGSSVHDLVTFYGMKNPKRGRGLSWEIDRMDPRKPYEDNNYEFVCYYCNNAKADVFIGNEFCKTLGPAIGQTIKAALPAKTMCK